METVNKNQPAKSLQPAQGFIANPQIYLNEERGTLTHVLTDGIRITMAANLYRQILGLPFTKKEKETGESQIPRQAAYGLLARPNIYITKDGKYLVHRVLGIRVSKPVGYYKVILSKKDQEAAA